MSRRCWLVILTALFLAAGWWSVSLRAADPGGPFGPVEIPKTVQANGAALAPGTYTVRVTSEVSERERWIEFHAGPRLVGRELATVIPSAEIGGVAKQPSPRMGGVRVDLLKGVDYLRVWINDAGTHYLMHLPIT